MAHVRQRRACLGCTQQLGAFGQGVARGCCPFCRGSPVWQLVQQQRNPVCGEIRGAGASPGVGRSTAWVAGARHGKARQQVQRRTAAAPTTRNAGHGKANYCSVQPTQGVECEVPLHKTTEKKAAEGSAMSESSVEVGHAVAATSSRRRRQAPVSGAQAGTCQQRPTSVCPSLSSVRCC